MIRVEKGAVRKEKRGKKGARGQEREKERKRGEANRGIGQTK